MKKFLATLLSVLTIISMFTIGSSAYHEFFITEHDYIYGFVYEIDGKAFFSSDNAIEELRETGKTTVYLPMECEGKGVSIRTMGFGGSLGFGIPGSWVGSNSENKECIVDFVCSEEAEYDYERQIGYVSGLKYLGYCIGGIRMMFLSQDELETCLKDGVVYIEDLFLKQQEFTNAGNSFLIIPFGTWSYSYSFGRNIFAEYEDFNCERVYRVIINKDVMIEKCSCECHSNGFLKILIVLINFFRAFFGMDMCCRCQY